MHLSPSSSAPRASRRLRLPRMAAVLLFGAAALFPSAVALGATDGGLVVDTTVDADGDGAFSNLEEVRSASAPVTFRVVLTNTLDLDLTVSSLVNVMGATTQDLLAADVCPDLAGTFAADTSRTCTFTVDRYLHTYASQPRSELTNLVTATATVADEAPLVASDGATVVNPNAHRVSAAVELTNDADGDGTFTDDEQATGPGTDVPFRVVVQNTSPGAVVLAELWATWPGAAAPTDLLDRCPELDQMRLWGVGGGHDDGGHDDEGHDEGDDGHGEKPTRATCAYTLAAHAPAAGTDRADTVTVTLAKRHSPDRRASASDATTVRTAAVEPRTPPAAPEEPTKVPPEADPTPPATETPDTQAPDAPAPAAGSPVVQGATADRGAADDARDELAATGPALGLVLAALASLLLGGLAVRGGRPRPAGADRPGPTGSIGSVLQRPRSGHSDM